MICSYRSKAARLSGPRKDFARTEFAQSAIRIAAIINQKSEIKIGASEMARICMVAYTYYPTDTRVRREAEALVDRGDSVEIISLGQKGKKKRMCSTV
jgi:hypothetical protein